MSAKCSEPLISWLAVGAALLLLVGVVFALARSGRRGERSGP